MDGISFANRLVPNSDGSQCRGGTVAPTWSILGVMAKSDFAGTDFQKQVWQALLQIPFGETRSYKDIALQIGNVKAVRAVGAANGKNPISIIAPCHRVVGVNGKLVGFAGGLDNKDILLKLEKIAN